jgi:hypothetical protein
VTSTFVGVPRKNLGIGSVEFGSDTIRLNLISAPAEATNEASAAAMIAVMAAAATPAAMSLFRVEASLALASASALESGPPVLFVLDGELAFGAAGALAFGEFAFGAAGAEGAFASGAEGAFASGADGPEGAFTFGALISGAFGADGAEYSFLGLTVWIT